MKLPFILTTFLAFSPLTIQAQGLPANLPHGPTTAQVGVCFRPNDSQGCVSYIVDAINNAQSQIRVQAYNFTTPAILGALANAKKRGVDVEIILDKINDAKAKNKVDEAGNPIPEKKSRYTGATYESNANIPVYIDRRPRIAHNKLIIIDKHIIIGGSYNYSASAEKNNAENATFIDSSTVAQWFLDNWELRKEASEVFQSSSQ